MRKHISENPLCATRGTVCCWCRGELGCLLVGPYRSHVDSQCPQKTNFEVRILLFYIKVQFWLLGGLLPPLNLLLYTKILKTTSEGGSRLAVVPTGALLLTQASLIRSYSLRKRHLYSASEGFPKSISKAASLVNSAELNQLSECGRLYPAPPPISVLCGIKTLQSLSAQPLTPSPVALLPLFALFAFYWVLFSASFCLSRISEWWVYHWILFT